MKYNLAQEARIEPDQLAQNTKIRCCRPPRAVMDVGSGQAANQNLHQSSNILTLDHINITAPIYAGPLAWLSMCCPLHLAESPQNLAWSRFSTIYSIILQLTGRLLENYRININSYTNKNDVNGAILVSRPTWQEQGRKSPPKATLRISGPAACSFSTQSMNCHQTTR